MNSGDSACVIRMCEVDGIFKTKLLLTVSNWVMQETIILYNRQNNSDITSSYVINKIISKYLSEELQ